MGHSIKDLTDKVYTRMDIEWHKEIEKIFLIPFIHSFFTRRTKFIYNFYKLFSYLSYIIKIVTRGTPNLLKLKLFFITGR